MLPYFALVIHWFGDFFSWSEFVLESEGSHVIVESESESAYNHGSEIDDEDERFNQTRKYLKSDIHTQRESGVELSRVPKHIAYVGWFTVTVSYFLNCRF